MSLSDSEIADLINENASLLRDEVTRLDRKWWKSTEDKGRLDMLREKQKILSNLWAKHFIKFLK